MDDKTARDIMTADPVTIAPDAPVKEAARLFVDRNVGAIPVVEEGRLVGIVTESDLILQDVRLEFPTYIHLLDGFIMYPPSVTRFEPELKKAASATVREVMTLDPVVVRDDLPVAEVATLLVDRDVSRVPVMDGNDALVGIVTKHDIVKALAEEGM